MLTITVIDILKLLRIRNRKIIFQKGFRQLMTFEGLELQEYTDYISVTDFREGTFITSKQNTYEIGMKSYCPPAKTNFLGQIWYKQR